MSTKERIAKPRAREFNPSSKKVIQLNADSFKSKGDKKILKNVHTICAFRLPYAIPIPDGIYRVRVGRHIAEIQIKRVQRKQVEGFSGSGTIQMAFDKYGKSSFSSIQMKLPWGIDLSEEGRKPLLLGDIPPRRKAKEIVLRFLNRFIETVRYVTEEYWVEPARYQDILSYEVFYWDGKKRHQAGLTLLDTGVGGIRVGTGSPFQVKDEKMQELMDILLNELELDASKIFLLNSKDACLQDDFRLAILEAVTALEMVLYKFIRKRGKKLKIPQDELDNHIVNVGLTGNISVVLKMLTEGLQQIDAETLRACKGAIKIRNKVLHKGLRKVSSTDTERRVIQIEKMISYLGRLITTV